MRDDTDSALVCLYRRLRRSRYSISNSNPTWANIASQDFRVSRHNRSKLMKRTRGVGFPWNFLYCAYIPRIYALFGPIYPENHSPKPFAFARAKSENTIARGSL